MASAPDGRSANRVRRKPPPAFPYSPKYPHPDPSDPFAPLQVLRDRAHSAHTHAYFNPSNTSLVPTPSPPGESARFSTHLHANLPSLPRAVVHASRSTEPVPHFRDGYHSDNFRPTRPPRARTRPARDSNPYFTDPDVSSSTSSLTRHHERNRHPSEKPSERQYHYRRRSQTLSLIPQELPQVPLTDEPEHFERPATEESSTTEASHHTSAAFHLSQNQYTYDDRQSHGHVYGQADAPPTASTVDSHVHSHLQTSVHSGPTTPPMTPDDTLTTSSVSVRARSESLSPHTFVSELPPPSGSKDVFEEADLRSSPLDHAVIEGGHATIESGGLIEREVSQIRSADFPMLQGKPEPDSPPPLPVPPPRPLPVRPGSEPEQRFSIDSRRRSGAGLGGRKDSITNRLRRSSFLGRIRKLSDPSPPTRMNKLPLHETPSPYTSGGQAVRSVVGSMIAGGSSSLPEVVRVSGLTRETSDSKRAKMAHRKSLSHVSLGVTPLPNVSFGATASPGSPTENVSMTSTLVGGDSDQDVYAASTTASPAPRQLPQPPQPESAPQRPQTVAQALELTPLPPKDAPLPPVQKETRLPTPPRDAWRTSRAPAAPSGSEHDRRRETQHAHTRGAVHIHIEDLAPEATSHATLGRSSTLINTAHASAEMEMDEVVLMRHSRLERSPNYEPEQASPSPPLLANSLLARPTSTMATVSHHDVAPPAPVLLVSPSSTSAHLSVPVMSVAVPAMPSDIIPRRAPSPPTSSRRPSLLPSRPFSESPLPAPPEELEPPTPAPLPLSPPGRMDADLPTPLPQPPLPQPPPPPPLPSALPVARAPVDIIGRSEQASAPTSAPTRPRTPYDNPPRRSEERRPSDDRQERAATTYFPVVQGRPPEPPLPEPQPQSQSPLTSPSANRSRTKVAQTGTPYNSVRQRRPGQAQGTTTQAASHAQLPFRPTTPSPPQSAPSRVQSPQPSSVPRPQPALAPHPNASAATRVQSPQPFIVTSRAQSPPPPRAQSPPPVRAQSPPPLRAQSPPVQAGTPHAQQVLMRVAAPLPLPPPPSSYTSHGHGLSQERSFVSQPSSMDHGPDRDRDRSNAAAMSEESAIASPRYAASIESTPPPLPNTPSTTFTHPPRASATTKHRARSGRGLSEPETTTRVRATTNRRSCSRGRGIVEDASMATFDEHAGLTKDQLQRAAALTVVSQNGIRVPFGDLFRERKTIVIFIRHFWCAACQDYMYAISRNVNYEALKRADIDMVVIGNGSPGMIKSYRNIFRTSIPMFTDPTLRLYAALGMTYRSNDPGPDVEKGEYIRHGVIGGLAMVVRNALRVRMPVWERGGDSLQLGGEFVLGPGFTYTYAHRMTTTRSHAPIREVLRAAGYHRVASPGVTGYGGLALSHDEEEAWMQDRRRSLARMRAKREKRREVGAESDVYGPELGYGSDAGSGSVSVNGSWSSGAEKHELQERVAKKQEREREREREQDRSLRSKQKRQRRSLQVANPDVRSDHYDRHDHDHHDHRTHYGGARSHGSRNDTNRDDWPGGKISVEYLNRHGRREDGYETEDGETYARRQD